MYLLILIELLISKRGHEILTDAKNDHSITSDEVSVIVNETTWIERSWVLKNYWIVDNVIQVRKYYRSFWNLKFSITGLHVPSSHMWQSQRSNTGISQELVNEGFSVWKISAISQIRQLVSSYYCIQLVLNLNLNFGISYQKQ